MKKIESKLGSKTTSSRPSPHKQKEETGQRTSGNVVKAPKKKIAAVRNSSVSKTTLSARKRLVALAIEALKKEYPAPKCALEYETPFELLVAVVLSAQCTDKRVNMVLPGLFRRFPDVKAFAEAPVEEIEQAIQTCGLYRSKAANLSKTAKALVEKYEGIVPSTFEELITLPGVGRKTANCVLGVAFGVASGFVVDAHVLRLSQRIGFSDETTPEKVEDDLNRLTPRDEWIDLSHRLIYLGRQYCVARSPKCETCPLASFCLKRF